MRSKLDANECVGTTPKTQVSWGNAVYKPPPEIREATVAVYNATHRRVYKYCSVGSILRSLKDEARGGGNDDGRREREREREREPHGVCRGWLSSDSTCYGVVELKRLRVFRVQVRFISSRVAYERLSSC